MFRTLRTLEQLLQAGRVQGPQGETLIDLLRKDAGSLLYRRESFLSGLTEIEGYLATSPTLQPEPPGKLSHVYFLSYAREDASAADRIDRLLRDKDRPVWRDIRGLGPGEDHLEIIAAQVAACSSFVALHSTAYARNDYCKGELDRALQHLRTGPTPYRVVLLRLDAAHIPFNYGSRTWEWARTPEEQTAAVRQLLQYEFARFDSG